MLDYMVREHKMYIGEEDDFDIYRDYIKELYHKKKLKMPFSKAKRRSSFKFKTINGVVYKRNKEKIKPTTMFIAANAFYPMHKANAQKA